MDRTGRSSEVGNEALIFQPTSHAAPTILTNGMTADEKAKITFINRQAPLQSRGARRRLIEPSYPVAEPAHARSASVRLLPGGSTGFQSGRADQRPHLLNHRRRHGRLRARECRQRPVVGHGSGTETAKRGLREGLNRCGYGCLPALARSCIVQDCEWSRQGPDLSPPAAVIGQMFGRFDAAWVRQ